MVELSDKTVRIVSEREFFVSPDMRDVIRHVSENMGKRYATFLLCELYGIGALESYRVLDTLLRHAGEAT